MHHCLKHPDSTSYQDSPGHWKCKTCSVESVTRFRQKQKETLVKEAGGKCICCGYDRYVGALEFHHVDPTTKSFGIGSAGFTRSTAKVRVEAKKCILVCANCHREIEAGVRVVPVLPRPMDFSPT